jgi:hypothetical protein
LGQPIPTLPSREGLLFLIAGTPRSPVALAVLHLPLETFRGCTISLLYKLSANIKNIVIFIFSMLNKLYKTKPKTNLKGKIKRDCYKI